MGFKDILSKIGEKQKQRKALLKEADLQVRVQKIIEERQKSSNERELNVYQEEDREERIKVALEIMRKKRDEDIKFNHNPINTKNIMKSEWEVMREPNMFSKKSNMFSNHDLIHKNNPNLLKNNMKLLKGGNF